MDNTNSVAYIAKVRKVEGIVGADKIELCTVEGWTSTVQKGIHKEGDLVLCLTTDAVIPENLATKWGVINYLRNGNRVRTIKLRGVVSECILIPLFDFSTKGDKYEGRDLMVDLGIFKYEPPVKTVQGPGGRKYKYKDNSNFHIYYKFPNQKNTPNMFDEDDVVIISRKIHGTNTRYGIVKKQKISILDRIKRFFGNEWIDYEFIFGSHNVQKNEFGDNKGFYDNDHYKEILTKYHIKEKMWALVKDMSKEDIGNGFIIHGEIYGEGVQGQHYTYGLKGREAVFFDIELNDQYVDTPTFNAIIEMLDLPMVENLYIGNWSKEEQEKHVGGNVLNTSSPHEGIVVKSITGERSKVSKVINPDYHIFSEKKNVPDSH